jgi:hypothetical protein
MRDHQEGLGVHVRKFSTLNSHAGLRTEVVCAETLEAPGLIRNACSSWHARPAADPGRPGCEPKGVSKKLAARIRTLAETYHWWGDKRIAVVAGREGLKVTNKQVYRVICTARCRIEIRPLWHLPSP